VRSPVTEAWRISGVGLEKSRAFGLVLGHCLSPLFVSFEKAHIRYVSFSVYLARPCSLSENFLRRTSFVIPETCRLGSELGYRSVDDRGADLRFPTRTTPQATATFDRLMRHGQPAHPSPLVLQSVPRTAHCVRRCPIHVFASSRGEHRSRSAKRRRRPASLHVSLRSTGAVRVP